MTQQHPTAWMVETACRYLKAAQHMQRGFDMVDVAQINAAIGKKLNRVEIEDWVKLSSVETSFSGHMYLNESIVAKKRQEAQDIAWNQFKEVMDSLSAYRGTIVSIALMVQGLGKHIEFTI